MKDPVLICEKIMEEKEARQLSPLSLAFVGDAAQILFVRTHLVAKGGLSGGELHKATSSVISAVAQAEVLERAILPELTEAETDIYKRGRNNKNSTIAKNSGVIAYKKATGLEAVMGYLYLTGQSERLNYILKKAMEEK